MDPRDVRCTACAAQAGATCTTIGGDVRTHHAPRVQLAEHPEPCPSCGAGYAEPCLKVSGATSMYPHRARLRGRTDDVNYIVFAEQGLVKYRFVMDTDEVHEFEDLEEAVRFAEAHNVYDVDVVFPDGDARTIMLRPRFGSGCGIMPISKEMAPRYPSDWGRRLRFIIEYRAQNRCE